VITEFPVLGRPSGIAAGPDVALWFTERDGNRIGRITSDTGEPSSSGNASAWPTSASGTDGSAGQTQSAAATGFGASSSGGTAASCTARIPAIQLNLRKRFLSTRVVCDRAATVAETATLTVSARRKKGQGGGKAGDAGRRQRRPGRRTGRHGHAEPHAQRRRRAASGHQTASTLRRSALDDGGHVGGDQLFQP